MAKINKIKVNGLVYDVGGDELKQATETQLGGIKAKPKEEADTQEVHIDTASGQLFTKAGGGSAYYNPNKVSLFGFTPDASNNTFSLTSSSSSSLEVDWGDGTKETITSKITHTYTEPFKDIMIVVKGKIKDMIVNKNLNYMSLGENNITDMKQKFYQCNKLIKIDNFYYNYNRYVNADYMFANCINLKKFPDLDFSGRGISNLVATFQNTTVSQFNNIINTSEVRSSLLLFADCPYLMIAPYLNTSFMTSMEHMFLRDRELIYIPYYDCSKCTSFGSFCGQCENLQEIDILNINANLSIIDCQKMQQPALHHLIDNLVQQTSGTTKTLTMGETLLARVSEEYKQKASAKGWTLA